MSNSTIWTAIAAVAVLFVALAVFNWWVAERDERRWRRRLMEERQRMLIRQYRYGARIGDKK